MMLFSDTCIIRRSVTNIMIFIKTIPGDITPEIPGTSFSIIDNSVSALFIKMKKIFPESGQPG